VKRGFDPKLSAAGGRSLRFAARRGESSGTKQILVQTGQPLLVSSEIARRSDWYAWHNLVGYAALKLQGCTHARRLLRPPLS